MINIVRRHFEMRASSLHALFSETTPPSGQKRGVEQATAVKSWHSSGQFDCRAGLTVCRLEITFRNRNTVDKH